MMLGYIILTHSYICYSYVERVDKTGIGRNYFPSLIED